MFNIIYVELCEQFGCWRCRQYLRDKNLWGHLEYWQQLRISSRYWTICEHEMTRDIYDYLYSNNLLRQNLSNKIHHPNGPITQRILLIKIFIQKNRKFEFQVFFLVKPYKKGRWEDGRGRRGVEPNSIGNSKLREMSLSDGSTDVTVFQVNNYIFILNT